MKISIIYNCHDHMLFSQLTGGDSSPPTSEPLDMSFGSSNESTPEPGEESQRDWEKRMFRNRFRSFRDARSLDIATRILLHKLCYDRGISNDIFNLIYNNIWGHHWYNLYRTSNTHREMGDLNSAIPREVFDPNDPSGEINEEAENNYND